MQIPATYLTNLHDLSKELENALPSSSEFAKCHSLRELRVMTSRLAKKAYVFNEKESQSVAERLLYLIHISQNFSSPMQEIPHLIWGILVRAKMEQALEINSPPQAYSVKQMRSELERMIMQVDVEDHPLIDEVTQADDLKGLMVYTKNWFSMTHGFTSQLISLLQRCTGNIKKLVWENVSDELQDSEHHEKLRQRFLKSLGIHFQPMKVFEDQDYLSESLAVLNFRTAVCMLQNPYYALGSFYSIEASYPYACQRLVKGLRNRGFDEHSIESFALHLEADVEHAGAWLKCVEDPALSDEVRGYVVAGAKAQIHLRHKLYDAMRHVINHQWKQEAVSDSKAMSSGGEMLPPLHPVHLYG